MPANSKVKLLTPILWVVAIYFYFLIYAQFAFLELLKSAQPAPLSVKFVMGGMGAGGILGSLLTPWLLKKLAVDKLMKSAAAGCASIAIFSTAIHALPLFILLGSLMGMTLGILTVSLAAHIPRLFPDRFTALGVGIGTGLAYALCNLPLIFQAMPQLQSIYAALGMLLVATLPFNLSEDRDRPRLHPTPFALGILSLTLLVWLDSAAFYIIQQTPALKDDTWGSTLLGRNALVHLGIAILSGYLLSKHHFKLVCALALALLSTAALMLAHPELRHTAGILYPAGVSFYSVALVLFPAWLLGGNSRIAAKRAAILFAIAGWFGSAMGVGMGENLNAVPLAFILTAIALFLLPALLPLLRRRAKEILGIAAITAAIHTIYHHTYTNNGAPHSQSQRGKQIYLREGCIHCHTRYIRPNSSDKIKWGSHVSKTILTHHSPPLIGYRRQGPDLLHIASRRSPAWLKLHFINPKALNPYTPMPSYAHLFTHANPDGDALIAFLTNDPNRAKNLAARATTINNWHPNAPNHLANIKHGKQLFAQHCTACHGSSAHGDGKLAHFLLRPPADLASGPLPFTAAEPLRTARIIKFGQLGTDMPGHESLKDTQILDLVAYLHSLRRHQP